MANAAVEKGKDALVAGKKVTISVDNREVAFSPMVLSNMVYVPVRFFTETGLEVTWDGSDMRATVRDENGPTKKSVEYIAMRGQKNFRPTASMRPVYKEGRLWVPLASGLANFGLYAQWVPASNRINVKTNRPHPGG